jgi:hypothetical protein
MRGAGDRGWGNPPVSTNPEQGSATEETVAGCYHVIGIYVANIGFVDIESRLSQVIATPSVFQPNENRSFAQLAFASPSGHSIYITLLIHVIAFFRA